MKTHSLSSAVADGTITEAAAFCGLSPDDIANLYPLHGASKVLVRLRGIHGDARDIMSIAMLYTWGTQRLRFDGRDFTKNEIRDVTAVAQ